MPPNDASPRSLWEAISATALSSERCIGSVARQVALSDLAVGSSIENGPEKLRDISVLILTRKQLPAALILIEADGVAKRLVLCPPDFDLGQLPYIIATAEIDVIVSDYRRDELPCALPVPLIGCSDVIKPSSLTRHSSQRTQWVLFTSGTSGAPKMVLHSLASLTGAIQAHGPLSQAAVWSTFYDIRRYGGLQIFLRALLGKAALVLSDAQEAPAAFLARAGSRGVTHMTGTPSHWRRALMSGAAHSIDPQYVRLSGEIADQAILDSLRAEYPKAAVAHAFASTEAGVGFEVGDGLAGIPANYFKDHARGGALLKVKDGSLHIRSTRTASSYLGRESAGLRDTDGYVDTGDMLELREGRYYFSGRRGGIINVGGLKVHPEEVEAVINRHPRVQMSLVKSRKSPVTGAIVVAEIVLKPLARPSPAEDAALKSEIMANCQRSLAAHKVPAAIRFVPALEVTSSGKVARPDA
jgi:acyl-coenzyme A synthetase/AMP-(fatty) acid ligase